jgi:hypothetical protein
MKISLRTFLTLPWFGLLAVISPATPTIGRVEWALFITSNFASPSLYVYGTAMSGVSVCALVAEGTNREYPLELEEKSGTRVRAKLPAPSPSEMLIPVGRYRVKVGVPGQTVVSPNMIQVTGTSVAEFTSSSVQSLVRIEFKGTSLKHATRGLLRSDQGEVYGPWKSFEAADSSETLTAVWNSVPAGSYDVILKSSDNITLWISPTKFRVFANPTR